MNSTRVIDRRPTRSFATRGRDIPDRAPRGVVIGVTWQFHNPTRADRLSGTP